MSNINKQALREAAQEEIMLRSVSDTSDAWQDEASPDAVLALLDELEATEKSNAFLKGQLAELANFNPDWDKLEASYESWREIAAELLVAKDRIAELERGSKVIKCWSCQKSVTVDQITAEDGFCPSCNCGIDLEDYETAELVAAGIITKVGE